MASKGLNSEPEVCGEDSGEGPDLVLGSQEKGDLWDQT